MRRERLRPLPPPEVLAEMYPEPHDHRRWGQGHHDRVEATIALAQRHLDPAERRLVADLSCGNGEIARRICTDQPHGLHLGDYAGAEMRVGETGYLGAIEQTVTMLPLVDVFVCSETIEHLDDPGAVLAMVRTRSERLVLSTPLDCWDDTNAEHLWAWDREGVEDLAMRAGWRVLDYDDEPAFVRLPTEAYTYGIWIFT